MVSLEVVRREGGEVGGGRGLWSCWVEGGEGLMGCNVVEGN